MLKISFSGKGVSFLQDEIKRRQVNAKAINLKDSFKSVKLFLG